MRPIAGGLILLTTLCTARGQAPSIDTIEPSALAPGQTTVVTLTGENLGDPIQLWTSFPCSTQPAESRTSETERTTDRCRFELSVPKAAGPGVGAIRLMTRRGISAWKLILIDSFPTTQESGTNSTPALAQRIKIGEAVEGRCEELKSDYYRFHGRKGDRLQIDVVARRAGSSLDPYVRLVGPGNREQGINDDAPGLQGDSALASTLRQTGEYILELRDTQYRGGRRFHYRLRMATEPSFPGSLPFLSFSLPEKGFSGPAITAEIEPNDEPAQAQDIRLPIRMAGQFGRSHDRDVFEFEMPKGSRWIFSGRTRSLGSPCDLFLKIISTNGNKIATANLGPENEGTITNTFNEGGRYQLFVEELNHRGGGGMAYQIEVARAVPRFALTVEKESVQLPPGGSAELTILVERAEYDGEIELSGENMAAGFFLTNQVIAAKEKQGKVKIVAPSGARPGDWFHCRIIGRGTGKEKTLAAPVSTRAALRTLWPELGYPPEALEGWIAVSVAVPSGK